MMNYEECLFETWYLGQFCLDSLSRVRLSFTICEYFEMRKVSELHLVLIVVLTVRKKNVLTIP